MVNGKTVAINIAVCVAVFLGLASAWNGAVVAQHYASAQGVTPGQAGTLGATSLGAILSGALALIAKFWKPAADTPEAKFKAKLDALAVLLDAGLIAQAKLFFKAIQVDGPPPAGSIVLRWDGQEPFDFSWGPRPKAPANSVKVTG